MANARSRTWVFTLNNPTAALDEHSFNRAYVVYQYEVGDSGTPHFQGAVYFASARTLAQVKKIMPTAHWETMRGTWQEAYNYATKDESRHGDQEQAGPWDFGDKTIVPVGAPGKRTDLITVKEQLDQGVSEKDIANDHFEVWLKHFRGFERYRMLTVTHRTWHTTALVYWGPSGTGKSRHALELGGDSQYWLQQPKHSGGDVWWDGYDGQKVVVIDEMGGWLPRVLCQRLIDRYPMHVETKGGAKPFLAEMVIFTSNKPPSLWWPRVGLGAMERRLTEPLGFVFWFGPNGEPDDVAEAQYLEEITAEHQDNQAMIHGGGPGHR